MLRCLRGRGQTAHVYASTLSLVQDVCCCCCCRRSHRRRCDSCCCHPCCCPSSTSSQSIACMLYESKQPACLAQRRAAAGRARTAHGADGLPGAALQLPQRDVPAGVPHSQQGALHAAHVSGPCGGHSCRVCTQLGSSTVAPNGALVAATACSAVRPVDGCSLLRCAACPAATLSHMQGGGTCGLNARHDTAAPWPWPLAASVISTGCLRHASTA